MHQDGSTQTVLMDKRQLTQARCSAADPRRWAAQRC
jgi:hypothetical protein